MSGQSAVDRLNTDLSHRYRIERQLGEGGMATVYLAEELKHKRRVALKVLKPELAAVVGAERFLAEIETTASLQHPHVLPLFDSGEAGGSLFYVMPYVEGESLRERLHREHQLPVQEAVRIAENVAEALAYAHSQGVIHRDIKPANILLQYGKPVVSDFGIALALGAAGEGRLTETGLSLGTPHYMSPEQATGDQSVGPATDIYALGCILFEMLVGEPPYTGSTPQAVLGKIVTGDAPSARAERKSVPPNVDAAIRRALEKVPADRFTSAQDLTRALGDRGFRHGEPVEASTQVGSRKRWLVAAGAVALIASAIAGWALRASPAVHPRRVVSFTILVGEEADIYLGGEQDANWGRPSATSLAISPDGEDLVYSAWEMDAEGNARSRLYVRPLDEERAEAIPGTEGGSNPFFSPDGAWVGFFAGSSLRRVPVVGGTAETILREVKIPDSGSRGATWGDDGSIVYAGIDGLFRVAVSGGVADRIVASDTLRLVASPRMLPGSATLLFTSWPSLNPDESEVVALDVASGDKRTLIANAMDPHYVETGHLLFMRQGALMAVELDGERIELVGQPVLMLEDVMQAVRMPNSDWETGAAQVAVSFTGDLVYAAGGVSPAESLALVRVTSLGEVRPLVSTPRWYVFPRVSPDGGRLAVPVRSGFGATLDVLSVERGTSEPLATEGFVNSRPAWSPDGQSIAFTSDREDRVYNVYVTSADGTVEPERVVPSQRTQSAASWSSRGVIMYLEAGDIWVLPQDAEPTPFFTSSATEQWPTFSPDGRWVAYGSDQTGRNEIYVRPYPGPDPVTRVSVEGGQAPAWSPDGRRLYFRSGPEGQMVLMASEMGLDEGRGVGRPMTVIDSWVYGTGSPVRGYDVFPDGSFLALRRTQSIDETRRESRRVDEFHVVLNWVEELRERVPVE